MIRPDEWNIHSGERNFSIFLTQFLFINDDDFINRHPGTYSYLTCLLLPKYANSGNRSSHQVSIIHLTNIFFFSILVSSGQESQSCINMAKIQFICWYVESKRWISTVLKDESRISLDLVVTTLVYLSSNMPQICNP